ncbi:MAG TPA: serine/threonine-protein kinase [Kofleriaceae bacterium]|nr:serine/threonine-protein kinase [Kofleriaceae bacterium]
MSGEYDRFGAYHVYECLGAGGMATVHRAALELEDGGTYEVALKRLLPQLADDQRFVGDFVREAKLAAHLDHPNIIRILELGRVNKIYFIAMELVRGTPLMKLMQRAYRHKRAPSIGVVLSIAREVMAALEYAHDSTDELGFARRIVHRDLTPSNLLVTETGHVKIIDFGVAKALSGQFATSSGLAKGKLGYMATEAIAGKDIDARADVFSAGVVLWELVCCRRLFKGRNDYEVVAAIRAGNVPVPSSIREDCPTELDEIVLRALAPQRDDRWASAAAMRRAIDNVVRFYGDRASADEVARWKRALPAEVPAAGRLESDAEPTAQRLSTDDLAAPDTLGDGSGREQPYDYPADPGDSAAYEHFLVDGDDFLVDAPSIELTYGSGSFERSDDGDTIESIVSHFERRSSSSGEL